MRVLAVTNLFPNEREPNRGIFNLQQFAALSRYAEVRVVSPVAWQPWAHGFGRPTRYEGTWSGIPATYPFYYFTPRVARSAYAAWMYGSLRGTIRRVSHDFQPDVLLAAWAYPEAVATALLARELRLPWVAEVLGSDINVLAQAPLIRAQTRWALRQAYRTFAVSTPLKQRLVEIGLPADRVRVHHNGVDVERFRLQDRSAARRSTGLPLERQVIVCVGNLKVSKGAADLLEAARLLAADAAPAPLIVFVGEGPARSLLQQDIQRHHLHDTVRLVGAQPHAQVPDWIAAADLLCLPSHAEGCPNVVLEALACGRPVVASRVGSVPDFIDASCGAVVPPQQPSELAAALRTVVDREWDPTALRQRVMPLSWEENARVLAEELLRAIHGPDAVIESML